MSSATPINVRQENEAGAGEKPWILLNSYADPSFTMNLIVTGAVSVDMEGTLVNPNQNTITADDIFDLGSLQGITATTAMTLAGQPVVAIRANQTTGSGSTVLQVQQNGN